MTDLDGWTREYGRIQPPVLNPVLTGFNVNIDRILTVSRKLLESSDLASGNLAEFRARLIRSMESCTAEEWIIGDPDQYNRITAFFSGRGSLALGGQAGIAAVHLAGLGAPEVTCIVPALGKNAARLIRDRGIKVTGRVTGPDTIHTILEYPPGLVPLKEGAVPRSNRFIVSPQKTAGTTLLPDTTLLETLPRISSCTRAFLSGYQYLSKEEEFQKAACQIQALKRANRKMRIHVECVSGTEPAVSKGIMHTILPAADSAGMNEHELSLLLGHPTGPTPPDLLRGMLELAGITGLSRIHLHTYGYWLLLTRSDPAAVAGSRNALLYAARVVADTYGNGNAAVTPRGVDAVNNLLEQGDAGTLPGTAAIGSYTLIAIPALIIDNATRTVGMGDTISSTAFVADPF